MQYSGITLFKEDKTMPDEQLSARHKIAILIDGDNAQANLLPQTLVAAIGPPPA
jgi:hypothetical protein